MKHMVEVPATFIVVVDAADDREAIRRADQEVLRLVRMMPANGQDGSPEHCVQFEAHIHAHRKVHSEFQQRSRRRGN